MSQSELSEWATLGVPGRNSYRVRGDVVDMRRPILRENTVELRALPQNLTIDLSRTALIVIDMQNDFCATGGWIDSLGINLAGARALIEPINSVTSSLRRQSVPIIWLNWGVRPDRLNLPPGTQHPFNPNGSAPGLAGAMNGVGGEHHVLEKGSWGAAIIDDLHQEPDDVQVTKHRISGFWDSDLNSVLNNLQITTILFAGVNADHCVLGTLMDANFAGYDTILLEDCTATTSPEYCMRATLHNVRFCFGFTVTSVDLLSGLPAA